MSPKSTHKVWDVVVIGGGAAGMMAAGRAAEMGKSVLLLEKNSGLGKKLLITGGGRCNLTNYTLDNKELVSSYGDTPKALFSVFTQFDVQRTLQFFNDRGLETKIENAGRVFPITDKAESVWEILTEYISSGNVQVKTDSTVNGIAIDKGSGHFKISTNSAEVIAKSCVVATGGTSHPETGCTGEGFKWLKKLGHTIIDNNFALVPIALKDDWVKKLAGVSISDIKLSVFSGGKKHIAKHGRILFTHVGISGPTVLNMSAQVGDLLQYGDVVIELDLFPELEYPAVNARLLQLFSNDQNKQIKNVLNKLIPSTLVQIVLELSQINPDKPNNSVTKEERARLIKVLKAIPLNVKALLGADKAIVAAGGVKIEEVDFKTMQSRIVPRLFLVGDVLNINRPSGGYSLQLCWATGYVAGENS